MPAKPDHLARGPSLIPLLQRSPRVRSTFYLGSMVVLLSAARALNDKLVTELGQQLDAWERNKAISCVIITGAGRAFAAGQTWTTRYAIAVEAI